MISHVDKQFGGELASAARWSVRARRETRRLRRLPGHRQLLGAPEFFQPPGHEVLDAGQAARVRSLGVQGQQARACAHGATGGTRWTPGGGHRRVLAVVAYLNP
jgi:hypothetical protein